MTERQRVVIGVLVGVVALLALLVLVQALATPAPMPDLPQPLSPSHWLQLTRWT